MDVKTATTKSEEDMRKMIIEGYIKKFITDMQKKLFLNDHKGNRKAWLAQDKWHLYGRLIDETIELRRALDDGSAEEIIQECADVGNFAMMITDRVRAEERKRKRNG